MLFLSGGYSRAAVTNWGIGVTASLAVAVDGTYFVAVTTNVSGASYTLVATVTPAGSPVAIPASDIPGTPIILGTAVASIIDTATRPRDVFAIDLSAASVRHLHGPFGQQHRVGSRQPRFDLIRRRWVRAEESPTGATVRCSRSPLQRTARTT